MPPGKPDPGETGGGGSAPATVSIVKALELVGKVAAPTTILTALLFYYGWMRTNALLLYFGVSQTMLDLSVQDYLQRSVSVMFPPLRWILVLSLAAVLGHMWISQSIRGPSGRRLRLSTWLARLILALGVLLVLGSEAVLRFGLGQIEYLYYPLAWTIGVGLVAYGVYLHMQLRRARSEAGKSTSSTSVVGRGLRRLSWGLVAATLLMGLFWIVADFADWFGTWQAGQIAEHLAHYPSVTLYSQEPLGLEVPGVTAVQVSEVPSAYQYRYTGLKFLLRSDDKYFLLPESWSRSNPVTIILPDDASIRVETSPGAPPEP